jgi:GNAT superfamily N-acetyltransferase
VAKKTITANTICDATDQAGRRPATETWPGDSTHRRALSRASTVKPATTGNSRILPIRVVDLEGFAGRCEHAATEEVLPLTAHRARAHAANPYAAPDDVGLLVAYERDRCVGYLGLMPGRLRIGERLEKMYWLSTWYVHPQHRNTSLGATLMLRALSLECDLVVTGISLEAERVYRALALREVGPLEYISLTRAKPHRVPLQWPPGTWRLSRLLTAAGKWRARHKWRARFRSFDDELRIDRWRYRARPSVSSPITPSGETGDVAFHRGPEIVNWMLTYPWIGEHRTRKPSGYFFSDVRDAFRHVLLAVHNASDDAYRGFVTLSLSANGGRSTLKVLDHALPLDERDACLTCLALACAERCGIQRVELPKCCRSAAETFGKSWRLQRHRRVYFCHPRSADSPLATALDSLRLNYCDGDTPFT